MKIGSWKRMKDGPNGSIQWFNPANRMRIQITPSMFDYSRYYALFVYRARRNPPVSGSAPTFYKTFPTLLAASDFATSLMKRENLSFTDLNRDSKSDYNACVAYLKDMLHRLLTTRAFMKHKPGTNVYEWGKEYIKASFVTEGTNNDYFYFVFEPYNGKFNDMKFRISLGPWNNYGVGHYKEIGDDYYWNKIDAPLKKMVMTTMTISVLKETLSDWHFTHHRKGVKEQVVDIADFQSFGKQLDGVKKDLVWYQKDVKETEDQINEMILALKHLKGETTYEEREHIKRKYSPEKPSPIKNDAIVKEGLNKLKTYFENRVKKEYKLLDDKVIFFQKLLTEKYVGTVYTSDLEYIIDVLRRLRTRVVLMEDQYNAIHKEMWEFLEFDRE